jgi:TonB-dependent SusC/RagA subfamily outer membrane receptor
VRVTHSSRDCFGRVCREKRGAVNLYKKTGQYTREAVRAGKNINKMCFMVQLSSLGAAIANQSGAVEFRDHFKNGASSKSHMSRINFKFNQMSSNYCKVVVMIIVSAICVVGTVSAQTEPNIQQSNTPIIVIHRDIKSISPESVEITLLKDQEAVAVHGERGRNGVVMIAHKSNQSEKVDAPLIFIDGIEFGNIESISTESIDKITILKDQAAIEKYGERGKNGVVIITTKK